MRLFIAFDMPESIRRKAAELQKRIGDEHARIKWVEIENIHLTLKFLGEVDDSKVSIITDSLKKIKFTPFLFYVSGFGAFPSESYARVLWVGLKPAEKISELHERIDDAMKDAGFAKDGRFNPHVTLGRVNYVSGKQDFIRRLAELKGFEIRENFKFDRFKLKRSTLTGDGPVYEDLAAFEQG